MGRRGQMEQKVGRTAEGRVDNHGVAHRRVGDDVARGQTAGLQADHGARGAAGHVEPDGLARGRERRVRQGEAERLADDLRCRGRAEELTAAPRRDARAAWPAPTR